MKNLIYMLLIIPWYSWGQTTNNYTSTVTFTTTNTTPVSGDIVQYCVTVDDFTEVNADWFDGLEIVLTGANLVSYDSRPSNRWKTSYQSTDEPPGWLGWSYNDSNPSNQTWNDYGDDNFSQPWTFCFTVQFTSNTSSVDVNIWSDSQTGGWTSSTGSTPDGPYNLHNTSGMPVELAFFEGNCGELNWCTYSEINNSHFIVEMSADGYNWKEVGQMPGSGNSTDVIYYDYPINSIYPIEHYRLIQVDFNGDSDVSLPVTLRCTEESNKVTGIYTLQGEYVGNELNSNHTKGIYFITYQFGKPLKYYHNGL